MKSPTGRMAQQGPPMQSLHYRRQAANAERMIATDFSELEKRVLALMTPEERARIEGMEVWR